MEDGKSAVPYTKETRRMITLITSAWVILTLLTREHRECQGSRACPTHDHVKWLLTVT
jgi:hypothetical protein